ncbi:MAG: hypothetical protein JSR93_04290 [Verrucomicrobia bacterium]|nr:hypothetical protein [Verrucomicrobiota bacterium]
MMNLETLLQKAHWLNKREKKGILEAFAALDSNGLSMDEKSKLFRLVCSIPYAEMGVRSHGKLYIVIIEKCLQWLGIRFLFRRSVGAWNVHLCHAGRFGFEPKEFRKLLTDDARAVGIVIALIVEDIQIRKPAHHIFAEYNHNVMATTVAALQKAINILMQKNELCFRVEEDGLIGEQTRKAIAEANRLLQNPLPLKSFSESEIHSALKLLAVEEKIQVCPFVPQVQIRMDFGFLKKILFQSLREPAMLKKLPIVFHNHIDVPLYVSLGMKAYQQLSKPT